MSTTELFVELLIIGIGAAIWIVLLLLSVFGISWLPSEALLSVTALIPALAVVYVLGIVVDRLCDRLFELIWRESLFRQYYDNRQAYYDDRRILYLYGAGLAQLLEYGRSRLRICRGWAVNALLIALSLNLFAWTQIANGAVRLKVSLGGTLLLLLFAYANWYAWSQLTVTTYRKIQQQAAFIRHYKLHE